MDDLQGAKKYSRRSLICNIITTVIMIFIIIVIVTVLVSKDLTKGLGSPSGNSGDSGDLTQ
jgi:preprotein translocase subunit SecG